LRFILDSTPGGTRTRNLGIRSPLLFLLSYGGLLQKAKKK
jgi:hypothetical protein